MTVRSIEGGLMAEKNFPKGSEEWMMFMEFWKMCQKYWIPEASDEWWESTLNDIDSFQKRYGSTVFARGLGMALVNHLQNERMNQKQR